MIEPLENSIGIILYNQHSSGRSPDLDFSSFPAFLCFLLEYFLATVSWSFLEDCRCEIFPGSDVIGMSVTLP